MKKVLICGATGFIGKNVILNLAQNKNWHKKIHKTQLKPPP